MNPKDICYLSIDHLLTEYSTGSLSPVDTVEAIFQRIKDVDQKVNSYITVMEESARKEALEAENQIKKFGTSKKLFGIPVGLKDAIDVSGVRTTRGSKIYANHIANEDAQIVNNLRQQGAILTGKLNMDEFAFGLTTDCSYFGPTRNPWDLSRISGGSSGGSAASLAAGLCTGSIGTDAGGSIRVPASLCGVVGLKPTFGIISDAGIAPFCWSITHVGCLARTVKDVQTIFDVLIEDRVKDRPALKKSKESASKLDNGLKAIKVGILRDYYQLVTDDRVEKLFLDALDVLENLGAQVTEISIPVMEYSRVAGLVIIASEAASVYLNELRKNAESMIKEVRTRLMLGIALSAQDYVTAQRIRRMIKEEIFKALKSVDILAIPTTPIAAPPIKATHVEVRGKKVRAYNLLARFTTVFSLAGVPALSVLCGTTDKNLPVGLQLVGKPLDEYLLFKVGEEYQKTMDFYSRLKEII